MALVKVGALFLHEGKNGKYMSGDIEVSGRVYTVMVFKNSYKEKDTHPDYLINIPDDRDGGLSGQTPERNYRDEEPDSSSDRKHPYTKDDDSVPF